MRKGFNMNNRPLDSGFALVLAALCIALVGVSIITISRICADMSFEATGGELALHRDNLAASAAAFIEINARDHAGTDIDLATDLLCVPDASLNVSFAAPQPIINLSCRQGTRRITWTSDLPRIQQP